MKPEQPRLPHEVERSTRYKVTVHVEGEPHPYTSEYNHAFEVQHVLFSILEAMTNASTPLRLELTAVPAPQPPVSMPTT